jgi:hypothetical protein
MSEPCLVFQKAFATRDLRTFMGLVFPPTWSSIAARIMESGASMAAEPVSWAPRWTRVSPTVRHGRTAEQTAIKSCLYRAHDCLHQLWGLPIPSASMDEDDFFLYKRAQMCGEVAVLTLAEFALAGSIAQRHPELKPFLDTRNALPMMDVGGPLHGRSIAQIAARLDDTLHKQSRPRWVRDSGCATRFCDDYVPMLEGDRALIDHNWKVMLRTHWRPSSLPNARYNPTLDGLELTLWMIEDFYHLLDTDPVVDEGLASFNRSRRDSTVLPEGWNAP